MSLSDRIRTARHREDLSALPNLGGGLNAAASLAREQHARRVVEE